MIDLRAFKAFLALSLLCWGAVAQEDIGDDIGDTRIAAAADPAGTSPAGFYPGWYGGGIWFKNKLCCQRTQCTPGWRSTCGDTANCRNKHCRTQSASDGAICDINPCIQGNCFRGVCMGGSGAMCPDHPTECRQYKCSPKTGQCRESCPVPDGTPCRNGTGNCKCGTCIDIPPKCPPNPDKCNTYVFNPLATPKCTLTPTTCSQPPPGSQYECKTLRCKKSTGLCTAFWNKPDGTTCSVGTCKTGKCVPSKTCPAKCPAHKDPCKYYECDESSGDCSIVKNACDGAACPGGKCKNGTCIAAPKCPPQGCPTHPNNCKVFECDFETGKCTKVRNKDEGATCTANNGPGRCDGNGVCKADPSGICPAPCPKPGPTDCKQFLCDSKTSKCDVLANKTDGTICKTNAGLSGICLAGECTPQAPICEVPCPKDDPANECKRLSCEPTTGACSVPSNKADGIPCSVGTCQSGVCKPPATCPADPLLQPCLTYNQLANGTCVLVPRPDNTTCSDGRNCTIDDKCTAGVCSGTLKTCTSARRRRQAGGSTIVPCTVSECVEATGLCTDLPAPDNTACSDGNLCTTGDKCLQGKCTASPVVCNSTGAGQCKTRQCNNATGACDVANVPDLTTCSDGLLCTTNDFCIAGTCTGTPVPCAAPPNPCQTAACDSTTGVCTVINIAAGTFCGFGDGCTLSTCNGLGSCITSSSIDCSGLTDACNVGECRGGTCVRVPRTGSCNDGNPCTVGDTCTVQNGVGVCSPGTALQCNSPPNLCTLAGFCSGGQCVYPPKTCTQTSDPCNSQVCNNANGLCQPSPINNNGPCNDANACTTGEKCSNGVCGGGSTISCNDPPPQCKQYVCDPATGCKQENVQNGVGCYIDGPTGNCTAYSCQSGVCSPKFVVDCDSFGDNCNVGKCHVENGTCYADPTPKEGQDCTGTDKCLEGQQCTAGVCSGGSPKTCTLQPCDETRVCNPSTGACDITTPKVCSAAAPPQDQCTTPDCDPKIGCILKTTNNGDTCDDGLFCTTGSTCLNGDCQGGSPNTDCTGDPTTCTLSTCNEFTNTCDSITLDCTQPSGTCKVGSCNPSTGQCKIDNADVDTDCSAGVNTAAGCTGKCDNAGNCVESCPQCRQDGDCTIDIAVTQSLCIIGYCNAGTCDVKAAPVNTPCDDKLDCTESDKCNGAATVAATKCVGTPTVCPGGDQCNTALCEEGTGCKLIEKSGTCTPPSPFNVCDSSCVQGSCSTDPSDLANCPAEFCIDDDGCNYLDNVPGCKVGKCTANECSQEPAADGAFCTDGDVCTDDICASGVCQSQAKDCFVSTCNPGRCDVDVNGKAVCIDDFQDSTVSCNDGKTCTINDVCDGAGGCAGTLNCPNDQCKINGRCDAAGNCIWDDTDCSGVLVGDTRCKVAACDALTGCFLDNVEVGTPCTPATTGCQAFCDGAGACVDVCDGCAANSDCAFGECCCSGECKTERGGSCDFTCSDATCKKAGAGSGFKQCNCIKACDGTGCNSAGGNPCKSNGVCCCADAPVGAAWQSTCEKCTTACSKTCTGNLPLTERNDICNAPILP